MSGQHIPVMLDEVIHMLAPMDGGLYVDGTFGAGGYSRAILDAAACSVIGFDRDAVVLRAAEPMEKLYGDRLTLKRSRFGALEEVLSHEGVNTLDGLVLDLGVSSIQIDTPERGFSFQKDGPLDMRMGGPEETETPSAADVVNGASQDQLQVILSAYGEERRARSIAKAIVEERERAPITSTLSLSAIVERILGKPRPGAIHPATRTFQALRIYVNRELHELTEILFAAERLLRIGGRLVVVAFHSLEDRIVKTFLNTRCGKGGQGSRHAPPVPEASRTPSFHMLTRGAQSPSDAEVDANPRARSAKLRAAERADGDPWPQDWDRYGLISEGVL